MWTWFQTQRCELHFIWQIGVGLLLRGTDCLQEILFIILILTSLAHQEIQRLNLMHSVFCFNSDMNSSLLNTCIIRHSYNNLILCQIQNIKKLLKIPFSKSHVSMAVHRVGRTLLLDELDIQELFMRSSQVLQWFLLKQNPSVLFCGVRVVAVFAVSAKVCSPFVCASKTGDWTWLKEFYQRLIDQKWQRKKKSKEHWYQRAILSKFLYYRSVNVGDFE